MLFIRSGNQLKPILFAIAMLAGQLYAIAECLASNTIPEIIYHHQAPDSTLSNEDAVNRLMVQIEKQPNKPENYVRLAQAVLQMGLENSACETLDKMERACPGSFMNEFRKSLDDDELFAREFLMYAQLNYYAQPEVQYYIAKALREHNFVDKARDVLDKLTARGYYVKGAYSLAADIALQEQRWSDAYKYATKELKHNPSDLNAVQYRLWAMNKLGILSDAEAPALKAAYVSNPASTDIGVLYGDFLVRNRRPEEAVKPLLHGLTATSDERMLQLAETDLCRIFAKQTDPQIDDMFYSFLRQQNPDVLLKSLLQLKVARVLITTGRYELAKRYLTDSLSTSTFFSAGLYKDLARVAELQGSESDAQQYYERAFSIDPNNKATWLQYQQFKAAMERKKQRKLASQRDIAGRIKKVLQPPAASTGVATRKKPAMVDWQWR